MSSLIAWIMRAIPFGTIIMYGAMGETITEKSGNLNLGVPGIMYLGGFAGFASAYFYENSVANPNPVLSVLIALICALAASALGGLIYAFLTISLRANQNVTGLALTTFGMGVANFFGVFILNGATYSAAPLANKAFAAKIPVLSLNQLLMDNAALVQAPTIRPPREKTGSTDFGNVMHMLPGCCLRVKFVPSGTASHSQEYIQAGKTEDAHNCVIYGAKALAGTAWDLILDPALLSDIEEEFARNRKEFG